MDSIIKALDTFDLNMKIIRQNSNCTEYHIQNKNGIGRFVSYEILHGIELTYNILQFAKDFDDNMESTNIIEINHCLEGRYECEFEKKGYIYLDEGDLSVSNFFDRKISSSFPLGYFKGISVIIHLDEAMRSIEKMKLPNYIDLYKLMEKLHTYDNCFIIREKDRIKNIFSELYSVKEEFLNTYHQIKVIELLLFLSVTNIEEEERPYYSKEQVEITKQIRDYLITNINEHITIEEVSRKYGIGITTLKRCFKGIYGMSIRNYVQYYRIKTAAAMLENSYDSIAIISGRVGYENQSKFAAAFKKITSMSPSEYRKSKHNTSYSA